jgi:hypothetical protein
MAIVTLVKCAHAHCHCLIDDREKYCSDECAKAKSHEKESCNCGHPGCKTAKNFMEEKAHPLKVD